MYVFLISLLILQPELVRKPVPPLEELRVVTKQLNETYPDLDKVKKSSKFPEDRVQLAKELLKQGVENAVSDAEAYVLLDEAMGLFKSAGDLSNALSCINQLSKRFEIDSLTLKIETVSVVSKSTNDFRMSFDTAIEVAKIAQDEGKFDKVAPLLQVAQAAATKLGDKKLTLLVTAIKKDVANLKKENDAYLKAVKILEMTPDDPASNAQVGKYWCLVRGDWSKGPEYILKGNDLSLKAVVQKEVDGPKDLREMSSLADTWWDLPGSGQVQVRYQREACYWYEIVAQYGVGLGKVTAEKRLQMTSGRSPRRPLKPGLIQLGYLDKELKKPGPNQITPNLNLNLDASAAGMGLPGDNFSLA